jgi:hypothetical protein
MTGIQTAILRWDDQEVGIESLDKLDAYISLLEKQGQRSDYPFFCELIIASLILMISFGRSLSAARFYDTSMKKDDYSLGEAVDGLEVVFYGGHWTEIDRRELIPYEQAREALRNFYATGNKPQNIRWQWND